MIVRSSRKQNFPSTSIDTISSLGKSRSFDILVLFSRALMKQSKKANKTRSLSILGKAIIILSKQEKETNQRSSPTDPGQIKSATAIRRFGQAIQEIKPLFHVRETGFGGAKYKIPHMIPFQKQNRIAVKWIMEILKTKRTCKAKALAQIIEACCSLQISSNTLETPCMAQHLLGKSKMRFSSPKNDFVKDHPIALRLKRRRDAMHRTAVKYRSGAHKRWWR
jgi:ribosomal protein S7